MIENNNDPGKITSDLHVKSEMGNDEKGIENFGICDKGSDMHNEQSLLSRLKSDFLNVVTLLFLYLLQGIPLGIVMAIPNILQKGNISFQDQAKFSFVSYPFSMKLLWAPIVDSFYSAKFGRRKSWLVPIQYFIGILLVIISYRIDDWIEINEMKNKKPEIVLLTAAFFCCTFLAATQDIVVDGWALTMLDKKNVGLASSCNTVGQTAGIFIGYVLCVALDSPNFSNEWLRSSPQPKGVVPIATFIGFWGVVFIVATTLIAFLKKDTSLKVVESGENLEIGFKRSYILLLKILKLKPVKDVALILLTCKIGFAATDAVFTLKLVKLGVPNDKVALMSIPLMPLQIILPFLITKYIVGPKPMNLFITVIPFRLVAGLIATTLVYVTPFFILDDKNFPLFYYILMIVVNGVYQIFVYCMFVSCMAFFAKVSDPRSGGTYMTLLNTLSNLGGTWPQTMALWLVDVLDYDYCYERNSDHPNQAGYVQTCYFFDGYFLETALCSMIGIIWYFWGKRRIEQLHNVGESAWMVENR